MPSEDWARVRGERWASQFDGMEATLAPVDTPLLDALQLDRRLRIAEVGCGAGGTTLQILRNAPAGSAVHGFDISPAVVSLARERVAAERQSIRFEVADMAKAPPPGPPYDRLVSRFGVMFFDDPPAAFTNLARWLAPQGRLAFAVWGPLADNLWMRRVREVVGSVVDVPAVDFEAPGPFRYAVADTLLTLLDAAGLRQLDARTWRGTLPVGGALSASDAANFALASFATFGELLAEAGEAARAEAHRALTESFSQHLHDGAVRLDAAVHIVTGVAV